MAEVLSLFSLLSIESRKQRGRFQFALLLAPLALSVAWNLQGLGRHDDVWGVFLFRAPLMNAIFMPVFVALFATRLMEMEHSGETWKLLCTFARAQSVFFAKALYGSIRIFAALALQSLALLLVGTRAKPETPPPLAGLAWLFATNFLATEVLFLLHALMAFFARAQTASIVAGIAGSCAGLFMAFFPAGVWQRLVPWGLYECTISVQMDWNAQTNVLKFIRAPFPWKDLGVCALWLAALAAAVAFLLRNGNTEDCGGFFRRAHKARTERAANAEKAGRAEPCAAGGKAGASSRGASRSKHLRFPTELAKMRQSAVWIALFALPAISALIGTANYLGNIEVLRHGWYDLWSQHTLFLNYFFQPALIGVFASCIWRPEHSGTNWNQLLVSASAVRIVAEKYLAALLFCALSVLWTAALFVLCGKAAGIGGALPAKFPEWIACGIIGSGCVAGAQLFLSLVVRNFALPVGFAFAGSVAGLGMAAKWGQTYILPYSLLAVGMRSNNPFYELDYKAFALSAAAQLALFPALSVWHIRHTDAKTHN